MGCRHSSSPPASPSKIRPNGTPVLLTSRLSVHRSDENTYWMSKDMKSLTPKSLHSLKKSRDSRSQLISALFSISPSTFEQTLDGRGKNLIQRFDLDSACLLLEVSTTHTLLLDNRQFRLIEMETMKMELLTLPIDCLDVQEIVWSSKLDVFLVLTTDQLYQVSSKNFQLTSISQIQFITEGQRKSYMTADDDDLLINRSFGRDLRRYSLSQLSQTQTLRIYPDNEDICVTNVRLNSKKILALAISIGKHQMIDLFDLNNERLIRRIALESNENILYPIDLHDGGQWFAKTCTPCVNIGHCLFSSDGQITRLTLFPNQDNFIRAIRLSSDHRWLLICRKYSLEIYQPYTSMLPLIKDLVGFSSTSLK